MNNAVNFLHCIAFNFRTYNKRNSKVPNWRMQNYLIRGGVPTAVTVVTAVHAEMVQKCFMSKKKQNGKCGKNKTANMHLPRPLKNHSIRRFFGKALWHCYKGKKCEFSIENLRWIQLKKKKKITGSQILNQSGCHAPIDSGTRAAASINLYRYVVVALFSR